MSFWSGGGAGLLAGGMGLAGGIGANKSRAAATRSQRNWDEMMYNQRYQKTVQDMKRAGLNPALAYQQGTGGSSPTGQAAGVENVLEGAASSAREVGMMKAQIDNIKADTALKAKQTEKTDGDAGWSQALGSVGDLMKSLIERTKGAEKGGTTSKALKEGWENPYINPLKESKRVKVKNKGPLQKNPAKQKQRRKHIEQNRTSANRR
jgi:hypothetical protein